MLQGSKASKAKERKGSPKAESLARVRALAESAASQAGETSAPIADITPLYSFGSFFALHCFVSSDRRRKTTKALVAKEMGALLRRSAETIAESIAEYNSSQITIRIVLTHFAPLPFPAQFACALFVLDIAGDCAKAYLTDKTKPKLQKTRKSPEALLPKVLGGVAWMELHAVCLGWKLAQNQTSLDWASSVTFSQ